MSEGLVERTYVNEVCLYSNRINQPMRDLTSILKSSVNAVNEYVCAMGLLSDSPGIDTQLDRSGVVALGILITSLCRLVIYKSTMPLGKYLHDIFDFTDI